MQPTTTQTTYRKLDMGDNRLLPGETGWCAWCRQTFVPKRLYSKPQYFCTPQCNHRWHNHVNYVRQALYNKMQGIPLSGGMQTSLQVEAERKLTNCDTQNHKPQDLVRKEHPTK